MNNDFKCIGIFGHPRHNTTLMIHKMLYEWLRFNGYKVIMDYKTTKKLHLKNVNTGSLMNIGQQADLAIIIGGDGNMLSAARTLACYDIKVIGINYGNLGFLADLNLDNAQQQLNDILKGCYILEKRFLLEAQICYKNYNKHISSAMNEVVLHSSKVAHMIDFEVYIDDIFAFSLRSEGLIVSTPTGSTAYSLSAGGPILTPSLDAIIIVPILPHTLSARPIVVNSNSIIRLHFLHQTNSLRINCDSQISLYFKGKEDILIRRYSNCLNLIHPKNYNYFNVLSDKLGWANKTF